MQCLVHKCLCFALIDQAAPQPAAAQNGKPAQSASETSTPAEIKERKQEVQGWIKDWRKR